MVRGWEDEVMNGMFRSDRLLSFCLTVLVTAPGPRPPGSPAQPEQSPGAPARRVVLTFDDLPMTGGPTCDAALVREVTAKLTGFLETRSLPAAGLATPGRACISPDLLRETLGRWREIGAVIGNHTATHPDLNSTSVPDYLADIERAQASIDEAVDTADRWFRPPYLERS